ncbi:MAG TPA: BrnT family toxin [Xanthobacteraceae bacterium]|nr:BrnT family toxin [Xanthobacteraceae bacterium]
MRNDAFEWDEVKAAENFAKHGVSFEQACEAFDDPSAVEFTDDREDYGEQRMILLGIVEARLLVVAYTVRGDRVRIISARGAERHERRQYHEEND